MNNIGDSAPFAPFFACNSCDQHESTEELTAKLFIKLQSDESLNQLSPDLKQKLVEYLRNVKKNVDKDVKTDDLTPKHPLEVCNWLIAEHLHRNGYRSTLSVFLIECDRSDHKIFNITDILTFIGIDLLTVKATKIVADYVDKSSKLLLWRILISNVCKAERSESVTRAIQTESGDETEIETKLRQLDAVYSKRKADVILKKQPINENLGLFEGIVSFRAKSEIVDEFRLGSERRSKVEKMKEMNDFRTKETEDYWKAVEERFRSRLDGLVAREQNVTEALERQKMNIEEELYRQRQQILSDVSSLKQRQDDWNDKKSRQEKDLRIEFQRLNDFKTELEKREAVVQEREERFDERLSEHKERLESKEKRRYEERIKNIEIREKELENEQKRLFQLEESLQIRRTKYDETVTESVKLQSELEDARREVAILSARETQEVFLLKEEVKRLRENLGNEQMRHGDVLRGANERFERQHIDMTALKLEFDRLNDKRLQEKLQYENELCKANETTKSFADRLNQQYRHIAVLNENIESLQRKVKSERFVTGNASELTPTKRFLRNDSFLNAGMDLNGTYFDTTLNATRLPPELELESRDNKWQDDDDEDLSFIEDSKSRIRALEHEADVLEHRYRALKRNDPFSTSNLTYFPSEACYRSPQKRNVRIRVQNRSDFAEREVMPSTERDPSQNAVSSEVVLRSERRASLVSIPIQRPIPPGVSEVVVERRSSSSVAVPRMVPVVEQDRLLDRLESDRELGFVEDSAPRMESVSPADFATEKKSEAELTLNVKPSNLGSTINLDSMWQRDEYSKSLDTSSVGDDEPQQSAPAPLNSTPYMIRNGKNFNRDFLQDTRLLEIDSKLGNEEEVSQRIEISGGISEEESRKDDFEW